MTFDTAKLHDGRLIARLSGITKAYPGVKALKGVDFEIFGGEVHCLVGENGAGKSTLMRVLSGAIEPDAGTINIDGKGVTLDPATAIQHGIGIVYQELDLVPAMSAAENIFLGHEPLLRAGFVDWRTLYAKTAELLEQLELKVSPKTIVRQLGPAQQQLVQIAKALSHDHRILILDEPTSSLTDNEAAHLFALIRRLRKQGLGIIYISHRLEEVLALGDRITVFRDGASVLTGPMQGMTQPDIIRAMVGRPAEEHAPRHARATDALAIEVKDLSRKGEFRKVSFAVREGEVLALAGIVGAGRSELLETLFGLRNADSGSILVGGKQVQIKSPRLAIAHGLGLVPEERRENGLVLARSVGDNLVYPIIDKLGNLLRFDGKKAREITERFIDRLSIKTPSAQTRVGSLSGGNQQKTVIGKWLAAGVRILLLDEPTRGVDVNAKSEIYHLIDELAQSGVAVIVASSELPEVLRVSDRILVLAHGQQAAVLETARTSQVEIMQHAVAAPPTNAAAGVAP